MAILRQFAGQLPEYDQNGKFDFNTIKLALDHGFTISKLYGHSK
jgi:hypothetical protein